MEVPRLPRESTNDVGRLLELQFCTPWAWSVVIHPMMTMFPIFPTRLLVRAIRGNNSLLSARPTKLGRAGQVGR
jgi:hypothetical protein